MRFAALLAARGGQEVRVPARVGNSRLLKPSRQASSVKCGARSSRKRRAAAGSGAAQRSRGSLDATRARGRAPPTTGSRVGRLGLGRPQPLVRHHTRSQLLAVYGAGVSRGGLEGARYERTTPQTVWEPGRPIQLGRSTSSVRAVYRARVLLAPPRTSADVSVPRLRYDVPPGFP